MSNLTPKESALLAAIAEGMDQPGCGWLHELADETRSTAGTLGSLVKKGLATSHQERSPGYPPAYWVELTPAGEAALAPAPEPTPAPAPCSLAALSADLGRSLGLSNGGRLAAPAPESSQAVIDQDGAVPLLSFQPGRHDGPYVAGDGVELWSFSSEAAALRYCQALRREGAEPVALAENACGQWRPILPGEALPPEPLAQDGPAPELPSFVCRAQDDLALALAWDDLSPEALREAQDDLALSLG